MRRPWASACKVGASTPRRGGRAAQRMSPPTTRSVSFSDAGESAPERLAEYGIELFWLKKHITGFILLAYMREQQRDTASSTSRFQTVLFQQYSAKLSTPSLPGRLARQAAQTQAGQAGRWVGVAFTRISYTLHLTPSYSLHPTPHVYLTPYSYILHQEIKGDEAGLERWRLQDGSTQPVRVTHVLRAKVSPP